MALKFVKQSVSTVVGETRIRLTKDDPWRDDDPVVKACPQFFTDEPSKVQTSAPKAGAVREEAAPEVEPEAEADGEPAPRARRTRKAAAK